MVTVHHLGSRQAGQISLQYSFKNCRKGRPSGLPFFAATLLELEALGRTRSAHYPGFKFWMMTLQFGVTQLRSALEWSDSALKMLGERGAGGADD
jgi:hypothetical protein